MLRKVAEQVGLPLVECTLELVKRLKIRQHIPRQMEEDVATNRSKLEAAQKYNILLREFPVAEVQSPHTSPVRAPIATCLLLQILPALLRYRCPYCY